jgi:archaellum component FlaD/FlaE
MDTRKPYVEPEDIDDGSANATVEWMEYLSDTFGIGGALYALRHYERLGWISGQARTTLTSYLRGLSTAELHNKKYDEPETVEGPLGAFSGTAFGVHAESLTFVARIAGDDLQEQMLLTRLAKNRTEHQQHTAE